MKTTEELTQLLKNSIDIDDYIEDNQEDISYKSFSEQINNYMVERGINRADLLKRTNIYNRYGYEIIDGQKKPARDKVFQLCLALNLSVADTNHLLNASGNSELYARSVRDSIIMYALNNNFSVIDCNEELFAHGLELLE